MMPTGPIAVLDSGLGGLTVVDALRKVLVGEDIIYFGDTAHLPYGNKSAATVTGFVRQIIQFLRPMHPKHIVIACNTATALAMEDSAISKVLHQMARTAAGMPASSDKKRIFSFFG